MTVLEIPVEAEVPMFGVGDWLCNQRFLLDRGEAHWLSILAQFDADGGYRDDGQLSCVSWLMWHTGMSRCTAFEKVRVARQLSRRPVLAEAFANGDVSYSAVRAISRLEDTDLDVDAALVALAKVGTVRDLERAVRHYQLCADQEKPPGIRRLDRRGMRSRRGWDGEAEVHIRFDEGDLQELEAAIDAFMPAPSAPEESSREDSSWLAQRVDALMDLIRAGRSAVRRSGTNTVVHIVAGPGLETPELLDGTPLPADIAARLACDSVSIDHRHPLYLGRTRRQWTRAQRQAIEVRDQGLCRFPGCEHRFCDVHHLCPWEAGGTTDIDNGLLLCRRHHTLIHAGFTATGSADGELTWHSPTGRQIAVTAPPRRAG